MKKRYVYGSVVAIILGAASYQILQKDSKTEKDQYKVAYIESKDDKEATTTGEETPEQVSAREGIAAEQIVVKITDKGYVTLHGDHYHFYSGKVPYDAIISEELVMKDPNYVFKQEDVVNEVKDGYIIKVGDTYYLYLKEGITPTNVRTKQEIEDQQLSGSSSSSGGQQSGGQGAGLRGGNTRRYQTSDGYVFDPTHVIDDLGDAFLVPHGTHFHYIPKKDLTPEELAAAQAYWNQKKTQPQQAGQPDNPTPVTHKPTPPAPPAPGNPNPNPWDSNDWRVLLRHLYSLPLEQRYREADGYVFDPVKIIRRLDYGVVVPHGDHFHVIPYSQLSPLEQKIARLIPLVGEPDHPGQGGQAQPPAQPKAPDKPKGPDKPKTPTPPSKPKEIILHFQGRTFPAVKKGLDGKPYSTSDGYVFSKASIYSVDKDGITVRHGSHFHFVPFNELEQYELDQVAVWLAVTGDDKHDNGFNMTEQPSIPIPLLLPQEGEVALKRTYLAQATGLSEDTIILMDTPQGPAFMYPHDDHHHVVLLSKLDVTKPFDDGHGKHEHDVPSSSLDDDHVHDPHHEGVEGDGNASGNQDEEHTHDGGAHSVNRQDGETHDNQFEDKKGDGEQENNSVELDGATASKKEGVAGIDYPTSDGFLFDGTGMQGWTNIGLLVNHNGHTHLLLKEDIAKSKWAHLLPKEDGGKPADEITLTPAQSQQRQALADALKLPLEKILVVTAGGKVIGFNYPHEDHYDFVPVVDEASSSTELTDTEKRELTAYVRKAYGLLLGTPVDFKDTIVIFAIPHPHQDYDPSRDYYSDVLDPSYDKGHVHPYFVPISRLKIPAKTGIPELDFENELLAAAERLGVPVGQVKMKNDKYFVLPGSDHDHYLNIFSLDGLKAYRENSLKLIYPRITTGSFEKDTVAAEIDRIQEAAKARFGDETLEYRRIRRALTQYREEIAVGHRSSTQAYVEALKAFESRYVLLQDGETTDPETNPLEARAATFMDTVNRLGNTKLSTYGTSVDTLVNRIREAVVAQDSQALDAVERYLEAIARVESAPNPHLPRVAYMDYFLRHVDSPYLTYDMREAVSSMVMELHQHDMKRTSFKPSLEAAVALKAQVKATIAAAQNQEIKLGTAYNKLNRMKVELVGRVNHWTNIFKYAITEEEKTDGLNGKLQVLPAIKPPKPKAPVEQPEKPKDSTPPSDQPKKPDTPTPSGGEEERLATWLREAPAYIKRYYGIDKREADVLVALEAKDATALSYVSAIHRIEVTNKNNYVGVRTAYLDYFIRQADQDYLSPELREKVASKAIFIQTASARDFKQVLIELIDLKSQVKAAQVAGQTYDIQDGPNYQAFVAKRDALIADVMERKDNLLRIGYITEEEKADGFGQAFPELRPRPAAGAPAQPSPSAPSEETTSTEEEAAGESTDSEADQATNSTPSNTEEDKEKDTAETVPATDTETTLRTEETSTETDASAVTEETDSTGDPQP